MHDTVGDISGQKGLKPTKNKRKTKDMDDIPNAPTGEPDDDIALVGAEKMDDGPTENLLEKGKKIALEDFQMVKVIGRGSFGKVYLVRHKE